MLVKVEFFSSILCSLKMIDRDLYQIKRNGWNDLSTFESEIFSAGLCLLDHNQLVAVFEGGVLDPVLE